MQILPLCRTLTSPPSLESLETALSQSPESPGTISWRVSSSRHPLRPHSGCLSCVGAQDQPASAPGFNLQPGKRRPFASMSPRQQTGATTASEDWNCKCSRSLCVFFPKLTKKAAAQLEASNRSAAARCLRRTTTRYSSISEVSRASASRALARDPRRGWPRCGAMVMLRWRRTLPTQGSSRVSIRL